jgi:hypothetical protein
MAILSVLINAGTKLGAMISAGISGQFKREKISL